MFKLLLYEKRNFHAPASKSIASSYLLGVVEDKGMSLKKKRKKNNTAAQEIQGFGAQKMKDSWDSNNHLIWQIVLSLLATRETKHKSAFGKKETKMVILGAHGPMNVFLKTSHPY